MLHTIYVTRIILCPLSALFGLHFMLPMVKSVTFTGLRRFDISRSTFVIFSFLCDVYVLPRSDELTRRTSVQTMFPYHNVRSINQLDTDTLLTEKPFTQFTSKSSWSVICCYKQHIHISNQFVEASNVMVRKHRLDGRTSRKFVRTR
jgi:hypothetical protein